MYYKTIILAVILGISSVLSAVPKDSKTRIINGDKATIEDFPYIVSIVGLHSVGTSYCGGTILTPDIIVTAAHCFGNSQHSSRYIVIAGSALRDQDGSLHFVSEFTIHEKYNEANVAPYYDVAVVKLAKPIELNNETTKAIEMFEYGRNISAGSKAVVSGWGAVATSGIMPEQLQSLQMKIVDKAECQKAWNTFTLVQNLFLFVYKMYYGVEYKLEMDGFICASSVNDKSACHGDSGGPLVVDDKLAGIVSFSKPDCTSEPKPNAFTEIAHYRKWIDEKVAQYSQK